MRLTDFCHPIELRAPAPRVFPDRSRHFRGGDTPRRIRLRTVFPGDRMFHDIRDRFGGSRSSVESSCSIASRPGVMSVGVLFPRRWCDRASDTPVASCLFDLRLSRFRGSCNLAVGPALHRFTTGRRKRQNAKPIVHAVS
jgi:hypothetical protein